MKKITVLDFSTKTANSYESSDPVHFIVDGMPCLYYADINAFKRDLTTYALGNDITTGGGKSNLVGYATIYKDDMARFTAGFAPALVNLDAYLICFKKLRSGPAPIAADGLNSVVPFQMLLALYEANAKYGLNVAAYAIEPNTTKTDETYAIATANTAASGGEYDYFTIPAGSPKVVVTKWTDQSTNPVMTWDAHISKIVNSPPQFLVELWKNNDKYAADSSLFHPIFAAFYDGSGGPRKDDLEIGHFENWDVRPADVRKQLASTHVNAINQEVFDIQPPAAPAVTTSEDELRKEYLEKLKDTIRDLVALYEQPGIVNDGNWKSRTAEVKTAYVTLFNVYGDNAPITSGSPDITNYTYGGKLIDPPLKYFVYDSGITDPYEFSSTRLKNAALVLLELISRIVVAPSENSNATTETILNDITKGGGRITNDNMRTRHGDVAAQDARVAVMKGLISSPGQRNRIELDKLIAQESATFDTRLAAITTEFAGVKIATVEDPYKRLAKTYAASLTDAELITAKVAVANIELDAVFQIIYKTYAQDRVKAVTDRLTAVGDNATILEQINDFEKSIAGTTYNSRADVDRELKNIEDDIKALEDAKAANDAAQDADAKAKAAADAEEKTRLEAIKKLLNNIVDEDMKKDLGSWPGTAQAFIDSLPSTVRKELRSEFSLPEKSKAFFEKGLAIPAALPVNDATREIYTSKEALTQGRLQAYIFAKMTTDATLKRKALAFSQISVK